MIPVWVREDSKHRVTVLELANTEDGVAIDPNKVWTEVGQILKAKWTETGARGAQTKREGWRWFQTGEQPDITSGRTQTKAAALFALLKACDMQMVTSDAPIPPLF